MRSYQTSRASQISHFRIKYEVGISFKRAIWEKLDKKNRSSRPEMFCKKCTTLLKKRLWRNCFPVNFPVNTFSCEAVYVTIGNPASCLALYLTGVHFQGKLQHVGHGGEQKIKFISSVHQQRKKWLEKYSCCITRCHSLSLVFIRCHWYHSLYHSLSLDLPLVYLFINDHFS